MSGPRKPSSRFCVSYHTGSWSDTEAEAQQDAMAILAKHGCGTVVITKYVRELSAPRLTPPEQQRSCG